MWFYWIGLLLSFTNIFRLLLFFLTQISRHLQDFLWFYFNLRLSFMHQNKSFGCFWYIDNVSFKFHGEIRHQIYGNNKIGIYNINPNVLDINQIGRGILLSRCINLWFFGYSLSIYQRQSEVSVLVGIEPTFFWLLGCYLTIRPKRP